MKIEKVLILKTIKAGKTVWDEGSVLTNEVEPIPTVLLNEVLRKTGTVEVLEQGQSVSNEPVLVSKTKFKDATTTTTVAAKKEKPKLKKKTKIKLKPKLVKRKK